MKKCYIGRIKLSKEDSEEWDGKPPFMYVTNGPDRANINKAIQFDNRDACVMALRNSFTVHKHLPSSKMEVLTILMYVDSIERI